MHDQASLHPHVIDKVSAIIARVWKTMQQSHVRYIHNEGQGITPGPHILMSHSQKNTKLENTLLYKNYYTGIFIYQYNMLSTM